MSAKTLVLFVLVLLLALAAPASMAGDVEAGKAKAAICMGCHGPQGMGANQTDTQPAYPQIAGQREAYLTESMKAYKTGKRKELQYPERKLMRSIAQGLSDKEIQNLAAYYASLR